MPHQAPTSPMVISDDVWQDRARLPIDNLKQQLELRAQSGQPMQGFSLVKADLRDINLVNKNARHGYRLSHSDLYRADLENAHLFKLDLSNSSLMKANLHNANLHYCNLQGCNLLGTNFKGAKLEHVNWGKELVQEQKARQTDDGLQRNALYQEAEEIYRAIRQAAEHQGLFETAGRFFQKEMVMRRRQYKRFSFNRMFSKLVDLFCGYGEKPMRVIIFSVLMIVVFATLYFFAGLSFSGDSLAFSSQQSLGDNLATYFSALYFSVVTFTTLGYGDLAPIGIARAFAALEAFLGSFTLALFVVVFVKKMTR